MASVLERDFDKLAVIDDDDDDDYDDEDDEDNHIH